MITQNIQKIKYLRLLMDSLKGGWVFDFVTKCPCGHLARIVMGKTKTELEEIHLNSPGIGLWQSRVSRCNETGIPVCVMSKALMDAGFTAKEIIALEDKAAHIENNSPNILHFISSWRSRIISETENMLSEADADLKVEVLLSFQTEKEAVNG